MIVIVVVHVLRRDCKKSGIAPLNAIIIIVVVVVHVLRGDCKTSGIVPLNANIINRCCCGACSHGRL